MPIQALDVQLVKSKVMLDVPEGGQGPTGVVIPDGVSNAIFPDVSELDRTVGRVKGRQVHVHIDTPTIDMYLGSYMGIDKPPSDPAISMTLVDTGESFDTRTEAFNRIAAYLTIGPNYAAYLFGNHITGMQTVTMFQRTEVVPPIGKALCLTKRQGFIDEVQQYIRVIDVGVVKQTFTDSQGDFDRYIVTLTLSDALRADFPGFDITRYEIDSTTLTNKTKISDTIVADAATYKGVAQLDEDADIGDFQIKVTSIFTQIVPSAQTETPIADARSNQLSSAVVAAGSPIVMVINAVLSITTALFIGGGILPGSLSIVRDGTTLADEGKVLKLGGAPKGAVDYENGILTLAENVWGTGGGTFTITYTPAAVPVVVTKSQGFDVKSTNRALNYVRTLGEIPQRGSLTVEYRAQGSWYKLRDDGSGALRGDDADYGAGQLNNTTGTVSITLGALPDVDTVIIYQWVQAAVAANDLTISNNGSFYWAVNADGDNTEEQGSLAFSPGGVTFSWNDGTARTMTDDSAGGFTGYGTGSIDYARGVAKISPTTLPAPGTQITINRDRHARLTGSFAVSDFTTEWHFTIATAVKPGTVFFQIPVQRKYRISAGPLTNFGPPITQLIVDNGLGGLDMYVSLSRDNAYVINVGSIDYPTGNVILDQSVLLSTPQMLVATKFDNLYQLAPFTGGSFLSQRF